MRYMLKKTTVDKGYKEWLTTFGKLAGNPSVQQLAAATAVGVGRVLYQMYVNGKSPTQALAQLPSDAMDLIVAYSRANLDRRRPSEPNLIEQSLKSARIMGDSEIAQRAAAFAGSIKRGKLKLEQIEDNLDGWVKQGLLTKDEQRTMLRKIDDELFGEEPTQQSFSVVHRDTDEERGQYETREEAEARARDLGSEWEVVEKGWKSDRVTYDTDSDGRFWAVNNDTGDKIGPFDDMDAAKAGAKEKVAKVGLAYEQGTRVEVPGGVGVVEDVSLLGRKYQVRLDDGDVKEYDASALNPVQRSWDKGYNDGVLGRRKAAPTVESNEAETHRQYHGVQKRHLCGSITLEQLQAECKSIDESVARNVKALSEENEYSQGYERGIQILSQAQDRQRRFGGQKSVNKTIIQFFENGKPVTDKVDYEESIWAEGQLSAHDEDVIEHLSVGEERPIDGGWTVRRYS